MYLYGMNRAFSGGGGGGSASVDVGDEVLRWWKRYEELSPPFSLSSDESTLRSPLWL